MTPRQTAVQALARRLVKVPWDHPRKEDFIAAAWTDLRAQATAVQLGAAILKKLPLSPTIRRRITTRTPASVRVIQYLDAMTPLARDRLVREALGMVCLSDYMYAMAALPLAVEPIQKIRFLPYAHARFRRFLQATAGEPRRAGPSTRA